MTFAEMIAAYRAGTVDTVTPYLWSDAEISGYLNDAQGEAVERANLLIEETNATYCSITLVPGTAEYSLQALVYDVLSAKLNGSSLTRTSRIDMDRGTLTDDIYISSPPDWESLTGIPTMFYATGTKIRIVPTPTVAGTLKVVVARMPVTMVSTPTPVNAEIPARYHSRMMDWAYRLGYSRPDADTHDKGKADDYEMKFIQSFGRYDDAILQQKKRVRRPQSY